MAKTATIDRVVRHAKRIANGKDKTVQPGKPTRFPEAAAINDCGWQGDLCLTLVESVPAGFVRIKNLQEFDRQLVPGDTQGARHCLRSLDGVEIYRPSDWGPESLVGPCLVFSREGTIDHPTHGAVTIPAGMTIQCSYQREWDAELRRQRRNAD